MPDPFVEVSWLLKYIGDPRLRIVDARNIPHGAPSAAPTGPQEYAAGHIRAAIYLDYAQELGDPATPYAARIAPAETFARTVGAKGIGSDAIVVAYDAATVPYAARIVWNFRYYGHVAAYVLAGGLPAWIAAGQAVTTEMPDFAPATFRAIEQPRVRATRSEVLDAIAGRSPAQLLETQRDTTYALRDEDIAGFVRLSGSQLLDDRRGGRMADPDVVARLIAERGLDRTQRTIVSCGSGVSAAGSYFALKAAGFTDVAVYDGSWLEWKHDALPVVAKPAVSATPGAP